MIVMPANNTGIVIGQLVGRFPGRLGHLFSPGGQRGPFDFMPYALDNGAFAKGSNWSESAWLGLLNWAKLSGKSPLWVLVPDVVADKEATLSRWRRYFRVSAAYGWPLAFAVQDGMEPGDVPPCASVIFVGGTTEWKWDTLRMWCGNFARVHVGRVNSYTRLWECHRAGAESCDGTGWTRGNKKQLNGLVSYLEESSEKARG